MTLQTTGVWVAAILTLFCYSYLFADNPLYRIAEHAYIGVAAAWGMILQIDQQIRPTITRSIAQEGRWWLIIPMVLGALIYTRYINKIAYVARYTVAFMVGVGSGVVLTRDFKTSVINQMIDTMRTWKGPGGIENFLVLVGVVTTLAYFFFTLKHRGAIGVAAKVGRFTMMVALGAAFGNTVMARVSLLLGRLQFLLGDWLHIL